MLTATYTLVALSVEQASLRVSLLSFQQYVRANLRQQNRITLGQLEYACEALNRLYQACHWRKTEIYLIPAIRQATEQADQLLDELSKLNQSALAVIRGIQDQLGSVGECADEQAGEICASIDSFCASLLTRLEKEERELFAIARSAICGDAWFALANQLLVHDARQVEARRSRPALLAPAAATAPAPAARAAADDDIVIPQLAVLPGPPVGEGGSAPLRRAAARPRITE